MTYVVPDPRTEAFARIPASRCLILSNSDVAWSGTAASTYAAARGIPGGNIITAALGTSSDWDPGSNAAIAALAATLDAARIAKDARAILIAPGCPTRVRVRGVVLSWSSYDSTASGYPSLGHLVQGCPSYAAIFSGGRVVSCRELGSGNWRWWIWGAPSGENVEAWSGRIAWQLGVSTDRQELSTTYQIVSVRTDASGPGGLSGGATMPTQLGTQLAGWRGARVIPAGRIGWGAWRNPASDWRETAGTWNGPLNSSIAAGALTAQPGRLLFSLFDATSSMRQWAGLAKRCSDWGYATGYFYRGTPTAAAEALCPAAGAEWTEAAFEGGSIVGEDYYLLGGDAVNADEPVTDEPFRSALDPLDGAAVTTMGASYGYDWAIRGLQTGAAAGVVDVCHRVAGETQTAWLNAWLTLRGMTGLEALWFYGGASFPQGDPLHRPFHFDPAGSLSLLESPNDSGWVPPDPPPPITGPGEMIYYGGSGGTFRSPRFTGHRRNFRR
jgi:hypothetical protein